MTRSPRAGLSPGAAACGIPAVLGLAIREARAKGAGRLVGSDHGSQDHLQGEGDLPIARDIRAFEDPTKEFGSPRRTGPASGKSPCRRGAAVRGLDLVAMYLRPGWRAHSNIL